MSRNIRSSIYLWFFLVIAAVVPAYAQVEQPRRFEVEMDEFEEAFTVINGEENGLLLYRPTDEFNKQASRKYQFISLDKELKEKWSYDLHIDKFSELIGYDYSDNNYYLLFKHVKGNSRDFRLWQFAASDGEKYQFTISNLVNLTVSEFEMSKYAAIIGGYFNLDPVVVFFDLDSKKSKVLPGIYGNKSLLQHIKVDEEKSTFLVLLSEKTFDKRNTLSVKAYNYDGELISNTVLEPDYDKGLVYGRAADFDEDVNLMSGTYSSKRGSTYSRGIYIATVDDFGEQNLRYLNYADLENFFSYMRAKKEKRVKERIERKKVAGKKVKFNYRLLVHEIISTEDQYLMVGEAFYPKYTSGSSANFYQYDYTPGIPNSATGMYFAGYRYTHAVVIGFDKEGNFLWDNSFEIEDLVTYNLDQFVHASVIDHDKVVLLYLYDNEIRSKIIKENEVLEGKSFDDIKMSFSADEVKDNSYETASLKKWYDDYFFAFGTQRIKNLKDSKVKLNRRVFYVNKITYL